MNLFEWDENSLQSPIKEVPWTLPISELEKVRNLGKDIVSWTMQRTLEVWSPKLKESKWYVIWNNDNSIL